MAPRGKNSGEDERIIVVPEGDELAFAQALAGPIINLEPVCPLCGHVGAHRVDVHRVTGAEHAMPCYLTWCAAHGVTPAVRNHEDMPPYETVRCEDGAGWTSAWRTRNVRCDACGYHSSPSAFCRPTGPTYERPDASL